MVEGNFLPSGGRKATLKLLSCEALPDAIFCANDLMAIGCYDVLKENGIRIGSDIAVLGYDDQEVAEHLFPTLSTVLLPHREMGTWTVQKLVKDEEITGFQKRLKCPVILRDSHSS